MQCTAVKAPIVEPEPIFAEQLPYVSNYDVFVSFRGSDTRSGFVSHLYQGLKDAGIHVFLDNEELTYGKRLGQELPQAIDNSRIYIPVLSKTYASSKWCLEELSRMVENKGKEILPVFYGVTSDDVKLKSGLFVNQLNSHRKREGIQTVEKWTNALKSIPERRGWQVPTDHKFKGDADFCREITKRVTIMLKVKHKQVPEGLIGMEDPTKNLIKLLDTGSPGMQAIGILGMGGIGKTTLAKVVYNKLCDSFECSTFLSDVRETLKDKGSIGCLELQKNLMKDICCQEDNDVRDVDDAIRIIQRNLRGKTVLMVFDDVSDPNQILKLIGNSFSSFNGESRILITTRDRRVLQIKGLTIKIYEMEEMNKQHSLQLFSRHAFGTSFPMYGYSVLSDEVLDLTAGLPLSLEVTGSLFFREGKEKWEYIIERLKKLPNKEVQERLKISYEDLSEEAKEIFLDIACFFVNEERTHEMYMWEACGFFPQLGIDELVSMCLIKIKEDRYWMHDHIKDLGREIIRQEGMKDREQCSRFWLKEDTINILSRRKKDNNKIKGIYLPNLEYADIGDEIWSLSRENFTNLVNLRFLQLENRSFHLQFYNGKCDKLKLKGTFDNIFPNLRWLSWHHMPSEQFDVTKLNLKKLVILDLSYSDFTENWGGWKELQSLHSLEVLDLTNCLRLRKTPDLLQYTSLKRLILDSCVSLQEIDPSIIHLKALKYLHCNDCLSLKRLPEEVFTLVQLEEMIVHFNHAADTIPNIPKSVGTLTSIVKLTLFNLQVITLPDSIGNLFNLQALDLRLNRKLQSLPDSIGGLFKLEDLLLAHCTGLTNLPDSLTSLLNLRILDLSHCNKLHELPDSVGHMFSLKEMDISFSGLNKLPRFITQQKMLQSIKAYKIDFEAVPTEIGELISLRILILEHSRISELPSLMQLRCLEEVNLDNCIGLEQLPDLPTSLVKLSVTGVSLLSIPDLLWLTNLTQLKLVLEAWENIDFSSTALTTNGLRYFSISSIETLSKLKELNLSLPGFFITEPSKLVSLVKLQDLTLMCSEMEKCVLSFPSRLRGLNVSVNKGTTSLCVIGLNHLKGLKVSDCGDLTEITGMGELEWLNSLEITRCNSLESFGDISKLKQLTSVEITECQKLRSDSCSYFNNLVSLEHLKIQGCPIFVENKSQSEMEVGYIDTMVKVTGEKTKKLALAVENASPWPSHFTSPANHHPILLPATNDEAAQHEFESYRDLDEQFVQTSSDEVVKRITIDQMANRGFCMDMPSSSSSTFSSIDNPSLDTNDDHDFPIHQQLLSLLLDNDNDDDNDDDDEVIPLAISSPKVVLKNFLSGGIETLEDESTFDLTAVLDAAKVLSLENPSNSSIWDHFSSKIQDAASSSYKLNLEKIQAAKDAHHRFSELKESAKETTTRFKVVMDETDRVKASEELIQFEITSLRAELAELQKKAAKINQKLHHAASKRQQVASEMEGQVRDLRATRHEIRTKNAERATSEAWFRSLEADWNAWRAHLDY